MEPLTSILTTVLALPVFIQDTEAVITIPIIMMDIMIRILMDHGDHGSP